MTYIDNDDNNMIAPPDLPNENEPQKDYIPPLKPSNWVWQSLLVTLCCFPIFGILGLVNGIQVNSNYYAANYDRAERLSNRARIWTLVGLVAGIINIIVMLFTMMRGDFLNEITQFIGDGAYSIYNY